VESSWPRGLKDGREERTPQIGMAGFNGKNLVKGRNAED
jgi:hypothetical protein